jgi:hypothetical protein
MDREVGTSLIMTLPCNNPTELILSDDQKTTDCYSLIYYCSICMHACMHSGYESTTRGSLIDVVVH